MTNEQQKPTTPTSNPAPAPQQEQQNQSPAKPSTDKPDTQPQQK